jgi:hypothetical protein
MAQGPPALKPRNKPAETMQRTSWEPNMELAKSKEATERPSDDRSSLGPSRGVRTANRRDDSIVELHDEAVERAWLLKTEMRWVRDDRNPLNAFRWFVWDRLGIGDPPSRATKKNHH